MRVDNQIIILDPCLIQRSPNGREFRVVGVEKDDSVQSQWINGAEKFCWIVTVKFLDDSHRVMLHFDHKDDCVKKEKAQRVIIIVDEASSCGNRTVVPAP